MIAKLRSWMRKIGDFLFGFDFFISYAHDDGMHYPRKLADRLTARKFRVFLDSRVYVAGDDLSSATRRRIRMSKYLLLLVRPKAVSSEWVLIELERCLAENGRPIAINFNNTLEKTHDDNKLKQLLQDKIYISETLEHVDAAPTEEAIAGIVKSFKSSRQETIRMRAIVAASAAMLSIAVFAGWQYMDSRKQVFLAQEQKALRLVANAERQMFRNPQESLILAAQGSEASDSPNAFQASKNAVRAALEVIRRRQEIQKEQNWGRNLFQSYIAGAWFEADLNARYSKNGELMLISTERGVSGNNPPGDAFLLNTNSLSLKKLDIGPAYGTRPQRAGTIATLTVRPEAGRDTIRFYCTAHPRATGRLEVSAGRPSVKFVAGGDDHLYWSRSRMDEGPADNIHRPVGRVTFEVESGRHGLTFLDKDHALSVFEIVEGEDKFQTRSDRRSRLDSKRRLEFFGFGSSGKRIYLSRQFNIEVYSIDGGFLKEFKTGGGCTKHPISHVAGVLDDKLIVYGDTDGRLIKLDYKTGECSSIWRRTGRILIKFDQSRSGQYAVLVFSDHTAYVWEIDPESSREDLMKLTSEGILSARFNPSIDNQLLTSGKDGLVTIWVLTQGGPQKVRDVHQAGEPIEFSMFSDDGQKIVTVTASKTVNIWDAMTGEALGSMQNRSLAKDDIDHQGTDTPQ